MGAIIKGDIDNGWKAYRKAMLPALMLPAELNRHRQTFYSGALLYFRILNNASKLPDNLAVMVVDTMDKELAEFEKGVQAAMQARADGIDATATKTEPAGSGAQGEKMEEHDFGWALAQMRQGKKVGRMGWNGKGMWISISPGSAALPADKFWNPNNRAFAEANGGKADVLPCITMKTADDKILMGWLASQTDMLAEDWEVVA